LEHGGDQVSGGEEPVRDRKYLLWIVLGTFFLVMFNLPESISASLRGGFREAIA